jgi:flavin reductase (DIM6/NTAB) family NADH-FMN oxidoreductase RutF
MAKIAKPGSTVLYPVPAVLVSCGLERPNIITIAWVGTVCSDPPAISISVRPERFSHNLLVKGGEFVVNLPRADQASIVDYCGHVSGRDVDKWKACNLTPAPATQVGVPLIAECPVALECRVTQQVTLGVHDLFVGEILAIQADEEVLTPQGQIDHVQAEPLTLTGGYYYRVGEQLGRFGDWRRAFD